MLNVIFGKIDEVIYNTSVYFKNTYEAEWLDEEFTKMMIEDIDKSKVLSGHAIESPGLGIIPTTELSRGVKTLMLIDNHPELIFNASNCGDNCARWLLKIGEKKDVTINLRHIMDFGEGEFEINIVNIGKPVTNMKDLVRIAGRYV